MVLLNHKPGSKAAMKQALESVAQYFVYQEVLDERDEDRQMWWPMLQDTRDEVLHALGIFTEMRVRA